MVQHICEWKLTKGTMKFALKLRCCRQPEKTFMVRGGARGGGGGGGHTHTYTYTHTQKHTTHTQTHYTQICLQERENRLGCYKIFFPGRKNLLGQRLDSKFAVIQISGCYKNIFPGKKKSFGATSRQ